MSVHWQEIAHGDGDAATNASLKEKATLVGRVGMMMLSVGTGAWRVRSYMNAVSRRLVTSDFVIFSIFYQSLSSSFHLFTFIVVTFLQQICQTHGTVQGLHRRAYR